MATVVLFSCVGLVVGSETATNAASERMAETMERTANQTTERQVRSEARGTREKKRPEALAALPALRCTSRVVPIRKPWPSGAR